MICVGGGGGAAAVLRLLLLRVIDMREKFDEIAS